MEKIYSYLPGVFNNALTILLCSFVFNTVDAQCVPTGMEDWNNFNITNVQILGDGASQINNFSGSDNATYSDFSAQMVNVTAGGTYNINIDHLKESWGNQKVVIWIDYQSDGSYQEVYNSGGYVDNNSGPTTTNTSFTVSNTALPGTAIIRIAASYCNTCGGGASISTDSCSYLGRAEIEDYTLNISQISTTPIITDDTLDVLINSPAGTDNQVNVAANDYIGTLGGDADNYNLLSNATNGVVTETSIDGVFEYVPNPGYIGSDSFTYQLCNQFGTCETGTVNVSVGFDYCTPTSSSGGTQFLENVSATGELSTFINNTSGDNGGYADFTSTIPALTLYKGETYSITATGYTQNSWEQLGWSVYIDLNGDGDFEDTGERLYDMNGTETTTAGYSTFTPQNITIPTSVITGYTVMRVGTRRYHSSSIPCGNNDGHTEEFEDYLIDFQINPSSGAEMDITGNNSNVIDGATTTNQTNLTDFGVYDIYSPIPLERTFTITNNGGTNLNLTGSPRVNITGSPDFTISAQPPVTTITGGNSTTFVVAFSPSAPTIGTRTATISIINDDADENPYTFTVEGYGDQTFPDTDKDGIPDNIDLDDDNDGLVDEYEQNSCLLNIGATTTTTVYLNEDFESGTTRGTIDGVAYCWEDGTGSCNSTPDLSDGEYVVYYKAANGDGTNDTPNGEVASWADTYWYPGLDHTPGDTNGRMAMFNADVDPGLFYKTTIVGVSPGVEITYGFSAINLDRADAPGASGRERPQVLIEILDPTGNLITSTTSIKIPPTTDYVNGDWEEVSATFNTSFTSFTVRLSNVAPGGLGNDLAIDDIYVYQTLCDLDGDGVEDSIDLDNDDDGIPNVVELQLTDDDKDGTVNNDSGAFTWVDANNNGLIDIYDHQDINGLNPGDSGFSGSLGTPIDLTDPKYDTDGDGVADYLDLDSDNDGIFDAVEYDNRGDVDIDGDGNGDGSDKQVLDSSGNPINNDDFDGDGILSPADNNDDDADDSDHGTANAYPTPLDDDGDGIPNFRDVDSTDNPNDFSNGSDIDTTEIYAHLDTDNDGVIDGTTDTDGDGILDAFDTDNTVFGSPRDLSDSHTLFFDGRNDYVEDANVINGWTNATLMAWIKIEPGATGDRVVVGQNSFNIMVTNAGRLKVETNSINLEGDSALPENIWVHVGATYNSATSSFVIYVNGHPLKSTSVSGSLASDTSSFTIGRTPNTDTRYFEGEIDEVRLFNEALSETSFQRMVYQELSDTNFNQGAIVPLNIDAANTFNTSLVRYFKMDTFKGDIVDDATTLTIDVGTGARLYNIKNIYFQTAPLPYETKAVGSWNSTNTWLHGDVWDIDAEATNQDWSIVHVKHSLTTATRHATAGLIVDAAVELSIQSDVELNNSWYLNLAGLIDLEGESQLIQTENSVLEATGSIERDQQGTENLYTYNYWSSPVHTSNPNADIDGDETYTVASILRDGEDANNPGSISFVGGYDGNNTTSPIQIADYWIWKFDDKSFDNYYAWEQTKSNGTLKAGEGYTMKGPGTGSVSTDKNYVFQGKPNNGTIALPITAGNASLVGNPYPSAIDAHAFINDNPHLDGTLYFWEHYGGNSHILKNYEGGYATYNYSGGVPTIAKATPDADVAQTGSSTKTPARYVPVGQGFFVKATSGGNVTFNNNQRIFETEASSTTSLFVRGTAKKTTTAATDSSLEDLRTKLRLNYNSPDGYTRQLLTTIDENATLQIDRGYDAPLIEDNEEDMFWTIGDNSFVIQGIDEASETTALPLSVKTQTAGEVVISLVELKYPTDGFELYLKDNLTQTYHDLLENSSYTTSVEEGITANRFEIVFAKPTNTLGISDNEITQDIISIYYDPSDAAIHITNPDNFSIENITGTNILGQNVLSELLNSSDKNITLPANLTLGVYIFTIETDHSTITKKMIIK
ncbi:LamG-like jellyroll fold domain-containing protein [Algibacter lectus]|uniref:LamG-like jellyroll fold domain-containing protein n=1 Tax=Algibacter lectus TaxID=221126 RepID=UPI002494FDFA|nr:LamG-like jellyroll fold domain-containing protein [Algibacter lectus]